MLWSFPWYLSKMYTGPHLGIPIRKRTELNKTFFHRVGNHALIQVVQLNELIPFFSCFKKKFEYFHSTNTIHYSFIFNLANRYELSEWNSLHPKIFVCNHDYFLPHSTKSLASRTTSQKDLRCRSTSFLNVTLGRQPRVLFPSLELLLTSNSRND